MDLQALLPQLLPTAIAWANFQSDHVGLMGQPLSASLIGVARRVGVRQPERIRVKLVDQLPMPEEPLLKEAAIQTGLLGPHMAGLTLGYSIFIVHGQDTVRLISHECRHVFQYETLGSIEQFLPVYLQQIITLGYQGAPLEIDARAHEITAA
jgi:hypothetical protein